MLNNQLTSLSQKIGAALKQRGLMLSCAESCTGGWIATVITSVAGSSEWFERGFVTYSNQAKMDMLAVSSTTLAQYGAVSKQTAIAMAEGALANSLAQISLSTTGIAGPTGGSEAKPLGLVWFAWACDFFPTIALSQTFKGDREQIRYQAVEFALTELLRLLVKSDPVIPHLQ